MAGLSHNPQDDVPSLQAKLRGQGQGEEQKKGERRGAESGVSVKRGERGAQGTEETGERSGAEGSR